jgi:hypothetical protein
MTYPATIGNPWAFSCAYTGPCDVDPIRPCGIDQTSTTWVQLRVPEPQAREIANRWRDGVGYVEVPKAEAIAVLTANPTWASLNPEAVARLLPQREGVVVEPEVKPKKLSPQERAEAALLADPRKANRVLARETHVDRTLIRETRKRLEAAGRIPAVAVADRIRKERPKRYKRRHERLAELAAKTARMRAMYGDDVSITQLRRRPT